MQQRTSHSMENDRVEADTVEEGKGERELLELLSENGTSDLDDLRW